MARYANNTTVSPERTQEQIKSTLRRYGADEFGVIESKEKAAVLFRVEGLQIRVMVDLPVVAEFATTETGKERSECGAYDAREKAIKQRWRALLLAIKAKLEAVETGISTIEQEFMPFVVMPDGRTLGEHIVPKLKQIAKTGTLPMLPVLPGKCA